MNTQIKEKWINALRSGEYTQNHGQLKDDDGYCCLGVLTDLYLKETNQEWQYNVECNCYEFNQSFGLLNKLVYQWAELPNHNPKIDGKHLSDYNDLERYNFNQIADLIEKNL